VFGLCVRSIEHARVRQLARSYPGHTGRRTHTRRHNKATRLRLHVAYEAGADRLQHSFVRRRVICAGCLRTAWNGCLRRHIQRP
jgi:hypothetical protein